MALHSRLVLPDAAVPLTAGCCFPMQPCGFSASSVKASNISADTAPPASNSFPMALCHGVQAGRPAALPRLPCQQQTSFGGEEYSGLASNLAHLGRMRLLPGRGEGVRCWIWLSPGLG